MARATPVQRPTRATPVASDSAGTLAEAHVYTYATRSSVFDPSAIEQATPVVLGNESEGIRLAIDTPGAATLPDATDIGGTGVEWTIVDMFDNAVSTDSLDLQTFIGWLTAPNFVNLPVDTYVAIAFTAGGVGTIGNAGVVVGLEYTATGPRAFFMVNAGAGAGWAGKTNATAVDTLARGFASWIGQGGGSTSIFKSVQVLDAYVRKSSVTNTTPGAVAGNQLTDGPFTHVALFAGWSGAGGSGTQTFDLSLRSLVAALHRFDDMEPKLSPTAPIAAVDPPLRIMEIGDSNTNGTTVDADYGGDPVHAGWTIRDAGVNLANYPATGTPGVGMMPYMVDLAIAAGASAGTRWYIRRGTNGADTNWPGTIHDQVANAIADQVALTGDPHLIILCFGANDANNATEAANYLEQMERAIVILRLHYPDATIVIKQEHSSDAGTYPEMPTVLAHQVTLAGRNPGVIVVPTPVGVGKADAIHFSSGSAGGQSQMATQLFATVYP